MSTDDEEREISLVKFSLEIEINFETNFENFPKENWPLKESKKL